MSVSSCNARASPSVALLPRLRTPSTFWAARTEVVNKDNRELKASWIDTSGNGDVLRLIRRSEGSCSEYVLIRSLLTANIMCLAQAGSSFAIILNCSIVARLRDENHLFR